MNLLTKSYFQSTSNLYKVISSGKEVKNGMQLMEEIIISDHFFYFSKNLLIPLLLNVPLKFIERYVESIFWKQLKVERFEYAYC